MRVVLGVCARAVYKKNFYENRRTRARYFSLLTFPPQLRIIIIIIIILFQDRLKSTRKSDRTGENLIPPDKYIITLQVI